MVEAGRKEGRGGNIACPSLPSSFQTKDTTTGSWPPAPQSLQLTDQRKGTITVLEVKFQVFLTIWCVELQARLHQGQSIRHPCLESVPQHHQQIGPMQQTREMGMKNIFFPIQRAWRRHPAGARDEAKRPNQGTSHHYCGQSFQTQRHQLQAFGV